jgi:lipoprotein-anchoring transpeptidase ErfK/SrfK
MRRQKFHRKLTRRDFLKLSAISMGALSLRPWTKLYSLPDFPQAERLGRICVGMSELKARPDFESNTLGPVYEDTILPWIREVVGPRIWYNNQRWVETPEGYIYCAEIQPVENHPQNPVDALPELGEQRGMWVEVTVPYVDAVNYSTGLNSAWWRQREEHGLPLRFYYKQVVWVDDLKTEADGSIWYRINEERYGNTDKFWSPAEAFRPITPEEISPITPEITDKRIEVDVSERVQMLSCYEGNSEVYFCRVSSGISGNDHGTPLASAPGFQIWRKLLSLHMGGSTAAASWDVPAVAWTSLFQGDGVAIHSTYWHNNFGHQMSHGCVNVSPEDAKWIFRWTQPAVTLATGDNNVTVTGDASTRVIVFES